MNKTISVSQIKEAAQEAYEQFKDNTDGKNADYIPYLANIDKNLFGISICLLAGSIGTDHLQYFLGSVLAKCQDSRMHFRDRFDPETVGRIS